MVQFILWKQSVCEFFLSWRCHCNFAALEISKRNICQMETTVMWTENVSDEKGSKVGAVLVYRYTGEFLLFSYPYMELWCSLLLFRSFVYRYTRTQPKSGTCSINKINVFLNFVAQALNFQVVLCVFRLNLWLLT